MSSIERRASKALLTSSSTSGTVGKGLIVGGTSALAVGALAMLLPFGVFFWAVAVIIAGLFMVEK